MPVCAILSWGNVAGCKVQGPCYLLESLRWLSLPLYYTSQPKVKSLCPIPGAGEGLLSEPGQLNLAPALLDGVWAGYPHVSLLQGGGLEPYVKGNVLVRATCSVFLPLLPISKMLVALDAIVGVWDGGCRRVSGAGALHSWTDLLSEMA